MNRRRNDLSVSGSKRIIKRNGARLQILGRPERRVQGRRGLAAAALEIQLRENQEARRHRSLLQQPLLRSLRRRLRLE